MTVTQNGDESNSGTLQQHWGKNDTQGEPCRCFLLIFPSPSDPETSTCIPAFTAAISPMDTLLAPVADRPHLWVFSLTSGQT